VGKSTRELKEAAGRAYEEGKWKRAGELYKTLLPEVGDDAAVLHRAGEVFRKLSQPALAVDCFAREALVYGRQGFLLKGIAVCKLILQMTPDHASTQNMLAGLYAEQRQQATGHGTSQPPLARPVERPAPRTAAGEIDTSVPDSDEALEPVSPTGDRILPRGAPLDTLELSRAVPGAERLPESGAIAIPELAPPTGPLTLPQTPLFSALQAADLAWLIERVRLVSLDKGEVVFAQGDVGEALYAIARGCVGVRHTTLDGTTLEVARLAEGSFFGEIALLTDHPRLCTVTTGEPTELIEIDRNVVSDLLMRSPRALGVLVQFLRERLTNTLLQTAPLFQRFPAPDRRALLTLFRFLEVGSGRVLIQEGRHGDSMFLVVAGECEVLTGGELLAALHPGDLFGEISLLDQVPATATVRTTRKSYVLELSRQAWSEVMMTHPQMLEYASDLADKRRRTLPLG
jgi:cAMP-dependent protein kinase regulator